MSKESNVEKTRGSRHYNCEAMKIAAMPGGGTTVGQVHDAIEALIASEVKKARLSDNHDWDVDTFKNQDVIVCKRCATTYQSNGNKPCKLVMAQVTTRDSHNFLHSNDQGAALQLAQSPGVPTTLTQEKNK